MVEMIYTAALYCKGERKGHVTEEWMQGALRLLQSHGLRVREYGVSETPACPQGKHPSRGSNPRLLAAVRSGALRSLEFYCDPTEREHRVAVWDSKAAISFSHGYAHLGLPASRGPGPADLLRQTYHLSRPLGRWPYGITYARSSSKATALYAIGIVGGDFPYPDETDATLDPIGAWCHELGRSRRHLKGKIRDVYPASLLSAKHVNARVGEGSTLLTAGWGAFERLDEDAWLWTVPDDQIPEARAALIRAKLLLCP